MDSHGTHYNDITRTSKHHTNSQQLDCFFKSLFMWVMDSPHKWPVMQKGFQILWQHHELHTTFEFHYNMILCNKFIHTTRDPTASRESKLRTFQGPFQDQSRYFKETYGKFLNADMPKIYHFNEETCPPQLLTKAHSIELNYFCILDEN